MKVEIPFVEELSALHVVKLFYLTAIITKMKIPRNRVL